MTANNRIPQLVDVRICVQSNNCWKRKMIQKSLITIENDGFLIRTCAGTPLHTHTPKLYWRWNWFLATKRWKWNMPLAKIPFNQLRIKFPCFSFLPRSLVISSCVYSSSFLLCLHCFRLFPMNRPLIEFTHSFKLVA